MLHKLERVLFWLFVATIPFQTRIILYQSGWSFQEYTSIALYATDVLFFFVLISWLIRSIIGKHVTFKRPDVYTAWVIFLCGAAFISLIAALEPLIGFYRIVKLLEGIALFFYVRSRGIDQVLTALIIGALWQARIGILQYLRQTDLGLQRIGESILSPDLQGIAKFINDSGDMVLRAYGITPHPNVLAAYLALALGAFYIYYLRKEPKHRYLWLIAYVVILFGFFATYARTVIGVWFLLCSIGLFFLWKKYHEHLRALIVLSVVTGVVFVGLFFHDVRGRFTIHQSDEAFVLRGYYNSQALRSGEGINMSGIGIGNFVPWLMQRAPNLPRSLLQPAHNLYLLIYAELGIIGAIVFLGLLSSFLYRLWRKSMKIEFALLIGLLMIAGFDHYFWTLQQGVLMFWFILGGIAHATDSR
jgi:hypothetical protein